jgi:hypothetical protein
MNGMTPEQQAVHRFLVMFGEPKTPDPALFLVEFEKAIRGYRPDVLEKAVDRVIRSNTFWPKPAEVREMADGISEVSASRESYSAILEERERGWKHPTPEERARTQQLFNMLNLKLKSIDGEPIDMSVAKDSQRPGFEKMQNASKNTHLHTLTDASKRMSGDRDA